jgi:hypothetical protein
MRTHHTNKQVAFKCKCVVYRKCASNVMTHNIQYNLRWHILSWVEQFTWLHADLYGNISDFFQPSSIHQRLTHCSTFTQLLNPLVLSRHWALSSRILAHKKSLLLLLPGLIFWRDFTYQSVNILRYVHKCMS